MLARCTFPAPGTGVACAVSGGADSLALLILAVEAGCRVTAIHVDHGLRPAGPAEALVVATAAARLGAGFRAVPAPVAPGPNLEARAREARFRALPPGALTGHTADDQAETVLLNLIRGAGLDGLAGIRPGPTKPILALRRRETRALCDELGFEVVEDPSNADLVFRRNRVRHEALPLLDAIAERDVAAVLARRAALLRDDADLLDSLAGALDPRDARALAAAPAPLARRAVRRWLVEELSAGHPPDASTVDRVLDVARRRSGACEVPGGARVERSGMRLSIRRG